MTYNRTRRVTQLHIEQCPLCNAWLMKKFRSDASVPRMVVPSDLIGVDAVAAILGLSRSQVARRAVAGTLPVLATVGRSGVLVFDRSDIEAVK